MRLVALALAAALACAAPGLFARGTASSHSSAHPAASSHSSTSHAATGSHSKTAPWVHRDAHGKIARVGGEFIVKRRSGSETDLDNAAAKRSY